MPSAMGLRMHNLVPKLFGLCYVSGIVSLSLYLSSCMGIFGLVLVMFSTFVLYLFLECGNSISRSLTDDHLFVDMVLLELPFTSYIEKYG